ncbi:glycosyltransferase involved in cell wall biosynthesis [Azonexus fungiphilus]|uniref:Glycosyltransferase involved in cell wall biosynthesis n=1 Tax=Azonexus fungiphilus TaxID=146940 RepID=A0A495WFH2_9RHOO|nr:GT4 family glycosyltransferase PelF [Azonexus fungiphilus]RKT60452.1 glycosyltransferase involved in cell wall biosynthesis [Azonexus fungiphilus]
MTFPTADQADIALLLEGTFPYVSGGVSSWVNQIIRAYPEYRFAIVFLGSRREDYDQPKYELPANVVHFEEYFLYDAIDTVFEPAARAGDAQAFRLSAAMHDKLLHGSAPAEALAAFREIAREMLPGGRLTLEDFLHSEAAWEIICDHYRRYCSDPSFVDYFWTVRIMHQPLWTLAHIARNLIPVRILHSVSTGYAGFLGALLHQSRGLPLVLSEHGIYTKERKIDLFKSEWIRDNRNVFQRDPTELSYFRKMWMGFFEWLGRFCYDAADPIIALYESNRLRQVADGAAAERTRNIPNGISLARFAPLRALRPATPPPVLCLIGRVVPIKDIKTFIRAMRRVVNRMPDAEGWIAGPEDEDQAYAQECHDLVRSLGLENHVRFLGFQKVEALLPKIGLTILSSISEALPLVILEGYAAGVPTVSTDVGSCRQLIEGLDDADRALGISGRVVKIADPQGLADAALELLGDTQAWQAASEAGIRRVERYYTDDLMFGSYRQVYEGAFARPDGAH